MYQWEIAAILWPYVAGALIAKVLGLKIISLKPLSSHEAKASHNYLEPFTNYDERGHKSIPYKTFSLELDSHSRPKSLTFIWPKGNSLFNKFAS